MRLRCAAYTRYSSDRQSPASIEDQLRMCREYAERQGWEVLEQHVYRDDAVSGAGSDRPGLTKLLEATSRTERPFDVLLLDDTSRLSRDLADSVRIVATLKFRGFRIVSVSQGIDSQDDQADLLMTVHGLVDSLYIKELAKKTHRGLQGRALHGLHTGGRCFGYDNVREGACVQYRANESEAVVVRRIFEMTADGGSLKTIAKTLNSEHVPPPRKRAGRNDAAWCHNAVREMLRNELCLGRLIWNRSRFVKQPGTNKRLRRMRPQFEWVILDKPELRIIDAELWDRVQKRIAWVNEKYNFGNRPGLVHPAALSSSLLTGFMKCGVCGNNLTIVTGRGKSGYPRYGCPRNVNRGACSNRLKERADALETRLFFGPQSAVLRPEVVGYAIEEFQRQLQSSLEGLDNRIGRMRERSDQLKKELESLVSNLAACRYAPAVVDAINSRQRELDEINRQLLSAEPDSVSAEIGRIRQFAAGQLGDIRKLLKVDVQKAKAELRKHVTAIRMVPQLEGKRGFYVAEGEWDLLGGYGEDFGTPSAECMALDQRRRRPRIPDW